MGAVRRNLSPMPGSEVALSSRRPLTGAGLKFNLVNVWALPLIIGSAAEYGVNIVLRYLESPAHGGAPG